MRVNAPRDQAPGRPKLSPPNPNSEEFGRFCFCKRELPDCAGPTAPGVPEFYALALKPIFSAHHKIKRYSNMSDAVQQTQNRALPRCVGASRRAYEPRDSLPSVRGRIFYSPSHCSRGMREDRYPTQEKPGESSVFMGAGAPI